ncbi:MAG: hypothetical protein HYW07_11860 [Candidatus Latescibacteria bacterium]|nr:hypothetical protein [Candidatus Latescibacterota bacterium]
MAYFLLSLALSMPAWSQDAFILHTGDTRSFLEVCGCTDEQLGGIARRGTLIERQRAAGDPFLLVDAGGFVEGEEELDQLRVETYARAMAQLGYGALNLAGGDFHFGAEFIARLARQISLPFISTNLRQPLAGVAPYLVRPLGRWQVGILGVGAPQADQFVDPAAALAAPIAQLRGQVDYLFLLSDLSAAENDTLAARFPELDLIVARQALARREGRPALVGSAPQGTRLGRLKLQAGPAGDPILAGAEELPVSVALPEAAAMKELVAAFQDTVARRSSLRTAPPSPFAAYALEADPTHTYAGEAACRPCHAQEHAQWRTTLHAHAFDTLRQRNRHFFPQCVSCHTTGFGLPGGFALDQPHQALAGVQCEICHGPGQQHVLRPETANIRRSVDAEFCRHCHTPVQSPGFAPVEYLARIDHRAAPQPLEQVLHQRLQQQGAVELELFVMSLCPYGMEAEQTLLPLLERFGDQVKLQLYYIADEQDQAKPRRSQARTQERAGCAGQASSGEGPFASLHGQPEIDEGRRQLIALQDFPERYRSYLLCRSRQGPGGDWQACARAAGLDPQALQQEAAGPRGEALFRQNIRLANSLGIDLSPTLLIEGEEFTGEFAPLPLARRLCRDQPAHPLCRELPACGSDTDCAPPTGKGALCRDPNTPQARCEYYEPVPFSLQVLDSAACEACNTGVFLASTLELFPQARVQVRRLETPEGEGLARRYGIQVFPAYIFSADFARDPRYARVRHLLEKKGESFLLVPRLVGASWWRQRPARPGQLEIFAPAWDPQAEAALLKDWPPDPSGLRLHLLQPGAGPGGEEVEVRACLSARQPGRYSAYAAARDSAADWRGAAALAGADVEALGACLEQGQGRQLLAAAAALADSLELEPGTLSALLDNRVLLRRTRPEDFWQLWKRGTRP